MKIAVYTSIFGGKDSIKENQFLSNDLDYICFTDKEVESDTWKVIIKKPTHKDPCRSAKAYKILPHKFLPEYDYSIWIDGNFVVRKHPRDLIEKYLDGCNFAAHDHNDQKISDPRKCIYSEAQACINLGKDKPLSIIEHMSKYRGMGYPENNGLTTNMLIIRRHNQNDVIKAMEMWWSEIENGSRRDQLSFNFVAWKLDLKFNYLKGNSRDNEYFKMVSGHQK